MTFFYSAFSTSNAMFLAMPGKGSQYAGAFFDADGDRPAGGTDYTLHIPADVPVANYWSLVLYDADTRCLIDNGGELSSIASNHNLTLNPYEPPTCPSVPNHPPTDRSTGSRPCRLELVRRAPPLRDPPRTSSTATGHPATSPKPRPRDPSSAVARPQYEATQALKIDLA